jgi:putative peptide zinc metalloprotease protein
MHALGPLAAMTTTIDVHVSPASVLGLAPRFERREGDAFVIGRRDTGTYLAISADAMSAIESLREGRSIDEVKKQLSDGDASELRLHDLIDTLMSAGFVESVSGTPVPNWMRLRRPTWASLRREQIAWMFSPVMAFCYASVVIAGIVVLVANPFYLPRPEATLIRNSAMLTALAGMLLSALMVAKHEAAHVIAGRFAGVSAYCRLSHRLFIPVVETDLTDLWLVSYRQRFLVCAAGLVSDALAAALAAIALWLRDRSLIAFGGDIEALLKLVILIAVAGMLFQFTVFLRTDVYYMIATTAGARNLAIEARQFLRGLLRGRIGTQRSVVRVYAIATLIGTTLLSIAGAVYLVMMLRLLRFIATGNTLVAGAAAEPSRVMSAISLFVIVSLLAISWLTARRGDRVEYRLRAPANL